MSQSVSPSCTVVVGLGDLRGRCTTTGKQGFCIGEIYGYRCLSHVGHCMTEEDSTATQIGLGAARQKRIGNRHRFKLRVLYLTQMSFASAMRNVNDRCF
jgi:hypothetical protein